jgi:hypothetical protein
MEEELVSPRAMAAEARRKKLLSRGASRLAQITGSLPSAGTSEDQGEPKRTALLLEAITH